MTISAASIAHALHNTAHHTRPNAARSEPFAQQLKAAQTGIPGKPAAQAGQLLSSDMTQALQTIR